MFLKKEDLIDLTGYKSKKLQTKWLIHRGYKFDIAADGTPKVLVSYVEAMLGMKTNERVKKSTSVDLSDKRFFA